MESPGLAHTSEQGSLIGWEDSGVNRSICAQAGGEACWWSLVLGVGLGLAFRISTGFLLVNRGVFCKTVVIPLVAITALESPDNLSRAEEDTGIPWCLRCASAQLVA